MTYFCLINPAPRGRSLNSKRTGIIRHSISRLHCRLFPRRHPEPTTRGALLRTINLRRVNSKLRPRQVSWTGREVSEGEAIQLVTGLPEVSTMATTTLVSGRFPPHLINTRLTSLLVSLAYFVRNHASSPSNLPRQEEILPESPGLQTETPGFAGDRDAFYTPIGTPDLPRPTTAFHPGTGQRTISASAFRRNKSSLNQSIDGAPVAPYTDAARETASIPAAKTGVDEIYQGSAPRPQHGRSTEPEHDNGNLEAQLDHTAARESIPPTYHESFSHSPTFEAGREDESANKDLR